MGKRKKKEEVYIVYITNLNFEVRFFQLLYGVAELQIFYDKLAKDFVSNFCLNFAVHG